MDGIRFKDLNKSRADVVITQINRYFADCIYDNDITKKKIFDALEMVNPLIHTTRVQGQFANLNVFSRVIDHIVMNH